MERKQSSGESAIDILETRYARGEVCRAEFEQVRRDLGEGGGNGAAARKRSSTRFLVAGTSVVVSAVLVLALASSIARGDGPYPGTFPGPGGMMGGGGMGGIGGMSGPRGPSQTTFSSNGERIYYTGISSSGRPIPRYGGPMWLSRHGGACANCHGEDGRGGQPVMMGTAIPADISYYTLTGDHVGSAGHDHRPYTDELIKRAVTRGLNPEGKSLNRTMPRWQMSDRDLRDLIEYLKTFPRSHDEMAGGWQHEDEPHDDGATEHSDSGDHSSSGIATGSQTEHGHADGEDHAALVRGEGGAEQPSYILLLSLVAVVGATFGTVFFLKKKEASVPATTTSGKGRGQQEGV